MPPMSCMSQTLNVIADDKQAEKKEQRVAVRIRLKKLGRRHRPYFRICVMDARTGRDGKVIEEVGTYDPMVRATEKRCTMRAERIDYWLGVGALPTEKVKVLIDKFKGKVPAVRMDQAKTRAIPEAPVRRPPRKRKEQPAEPVAEPATATTGQSAATESAQAPPASE